MFRRRSSGGTLASNIILLTLLMVSLTVTMGALTALGGVYDLARGEVSARHTAYLHAVVGDVSLRLDPAGRLVSRAISVAVDPRDGAIDRGALAAQFDTGVEYVDRLMFVQRDGTVISAHPAFQAPREGIDNPVVAAAVPDRPIYHYERVPGSLESWLWVARSVAGHDDLVMLARVRSGFVQLVVDRFSDAADGRSVMLVTPYGVTVAQSGGMAAPMRESVVFTPEEPGADSGTVSAVVDDGSVVWGRWADIAQYEGLEWRALIFEPRSVMVLATVRALTPAVVALALSGLFSLVLAAVFAGKLVSPLTRLEERAREAVTGAYVHQLASDRSDEVGRLAEAFNAIAVRLNALHDLAQLLASSSRLDQVLDGIVATIGHLVRSASVAVFLVDDQSGTLSLARSNASAGGSPPAIPLAADTWLVDAMHSSGPEVRLSLGADMASLVPGEYGRSVTVLTAPLVVGTEPLGVVVVIESAGHGFTDAETEMIRTFSAQAAVAVHNSRLFEIETRSRTEAEVLRAVAEQLSRPQALGAALRSVREPTSILLGASGDAMAVFKRSAFGLPAARDTVREQMLTEAWRQVATPGRPTVVLERGEAGPSDTFLDGFEASRALVAAVEFDGEPCAVLAFARRGERRFTARDHRLAAAIASQVSLAFESAFHYERARSKAESLETIFRISQVVSSSLQAKVVLNRVLDVVQRVFEADAVSLMTYDTDAQKLRTEMARGLVSSAILRYAADSGTDLVGQVFSGGEPVRVDDLITHGGEVCTLAHEQGMRSLISVPLLARGRSIGVLTVFSTAKGAFSDEDMGLLHTFASQAALAIDTAKLYGKEHMVASVLQASILPDTLPEFEEIESSSVYLPAGVEADIGGDYYDLFCGPEGSIFTVMGDVCGKGVAAATKTSMIKYTVRGLVAAGLGPARVLSEVNKAVASSGDPSDIVTLWIGAIDTDNRVLHYANGGHPAALLRKADGVILRLPPTGPLLGAMALAPYEQESVAVEEGDLLLLYTDGVTEARRGNKFFGEGRVRSALKRGRDADGVTQELLAALDRFVPGTIRDDAAVLAVRIRAKLAPGEG
ncbi:MAG: SpoIIE family protein phosphatase [Clostridiales bacterium]|nr:SpoIIE family protein phosphatase [Clostridiales bacterium]